MRNDGDWNNDVNQSICTAHRSSRNPTVVGVWVEAVLGIIRNHEELKLM
jgi:hypothetical protein